jgi:hypothetical protein
LLISSLFTSREIITKMQCYKNYPTENKCPQKISSPFGSQQPTRCVAAEREILRIVITITIFSQSIPFLQVNLFTCAILIFLYFIKPLVKRLVGEDVETCIISGLVGSFRFLFAAMTRCLDQKQLDTRTCELLASPPLHEPSLRQPGYG